MTKPKQKKTTTAKEKLVKKEKVISKKEKERMEAIMEEIYNHLEKNSNLYFLIGNNDFGVFTKKKELTVTTVVNKSLFQPFEKTLETIVHDTFIVEWGEATSKEKVKKLLDMGVKVYRVSTPEGAVSILNEA